MKREFDQYIDNYRTNCDQALWLSGESSSYFARYKAQKLAEWLPAKTSTSARILDFGCGDGVMTHFVHTYFPHAHMYGVDPSPKSIETAKKQFDQITFRVSSEESRHLDFDSHVFDIIFSAGVFHHIPFEQHTDYIQELFRILKPGGHLVIFELNPFNPLTMWTFKRNPIDRDATMMRPSYAHRLTKEYGKPRLLFYCFYPKPLNWLRFTEPFMTKIPFGALYATITQKEEARHAALTL